jgi:hypothetical protein
MTPPEKGTGRWALIRDEKVIAQGNGSVTIDTDEFDDCELKRISTQSRLSKRISSVRESAHERSETV